MLPLEHFLSEFDIRQACGVSLRALLVYELEVSLFESMLFWLLEEKDKETVGPRFCQLTT